MNMTEQQTSKPWWKQLWPWLLISGPAVAILGCAITIWLAVNLYADKPLRDGVVKQGLNSKKRRQANEVPPLNLDFVAILFGGGFGRGLIV
jgi:hypothetical protein